MAAGDLTYTGLYTGDANSTGVANAIDAANLAAATDFLFVIPLPGRDNQIKIFKVERAAA